jgi:hypothetical protein
VVPARIDLHLYRHRERGVSLGTLALPCLKDEELSILRRGAALFCEVTG